MADYVAFVFSLGGSMKFNNIDVSGEIIFSESPERISRNREKEIIYKSLNSNGYKFHWTNETSKPYAGVFYDGDKKIDLYIYVWNITPTYINNNPEQKGIQIGANVNNVGFNRPNTEYEKTILMGIYNCPKKLIIATWDKDNYKSHRQNTCYVSTSELKKGLDNSIYKCFHGCNVYTMTEDYFPIYVSHLTTGNSTDLDTSKGNLSKNNFKLEYDAGSKRRTKKNIAEMKERLAKINDTEKQSDTKRRIGQDLFRKMLIDLYGNKCALCDISTSCMLKASHIKEWGVSTDDERLDEHNGLLLCAHHDSLFDKHLLSFTDDGNPIISNTLSFEERKALNVDSIPSINVKPQMLPYLRYNRKKLK